MVMEDPAVDLDVPPCLFCAYRIVGRDGAKWICYSCGAIWAAFTEEDKVFLRVQKIHPA